MAADGKVTILVDVDGKQVKVLNNELDKVAEKGKKGSTSLKNFALGVAVFSLAKKGVDLLVSSLDGAIKRFDTLEKFPRVMKAMGHSTEDVASSTDKLANGIDGLPTTLDEVVGTAQRLTSITGNLRKSTDTTLALNNAFLASGASSADASRGLDQFSQMLSAGTVDLQSWKTLQETMPYALQKTAESFGFAGKSAQRDFYAALKSGQITFDQFSNRLVELDKGVGGFAELARENSKGIATSFNNLKNAVVRGVAGTIKALDDLSKEVSGKTIAEHFDSMKVVITAAFKVVNGAIKSSTPVFIFLFGVLDKGIGAAQALTPVLITLGSAILAMRAANTVVDMWGRFTTMWTGFTASAKSAVAVINLMTQAQAVCGSVTKAQMVINMANNGVLSVSNVLYGVLTGTISLSTAATIASTAAVTALKAALTALTGPIGWVIAGIGLLVGAGVALWQWLTRESEESKRLSKVQEELAESTDNLKKSVKDSAAARKDSLQDVEANRESYKKLSAEIVALSQKENKSAADKKNLQKKIQTLNDSVEGLNLAYDKNTDSLSHNAEQINARISAMEAESTWEASQKNLLDIEQQRADIGAQLAEIAKLRTEWNNASDVSDAKRREELKKLNEQELELQATQAALQTEYEQTSAVQQAAAEAMAAAAENGTNRQVIAYENMSEAQKTAIDNMRSKYGELLETTTGMFDAIEQKSAISIEQINANLETNRAAIEQWSSNLAILAERGVDQGVLEQLRQMGPEGAAQTQVFVNATDEELSVLQENFRANAEAAKNAMGSVMDSAGVEIPDKVKGLVTNITSGLQAELANANFASLGEEVPNGAAVGIENGSAKAVEATKSVGTKIQQGFKENLGIHSPSRVFTEFGGHITEGLANGITNGTNSPVGKVKNLAVKLREPFSGISGRFSEIGAMAMQGLAGGIQANAGVAIAAANSVASRVTSTIKRALDIHSPSRVMRDEVGRFIPQGIAVGIEADKDVLERTMAKLKQSVTITAPEVSLGLDKSLASQVTVRSSSKHTVTEKIEHVFDKSKEQVNRALEIAEEALQRPVYMVLDDGTLVGRLGEKLSHYQSPADKIDMMLRRI
ncbi:TPA: tape measure protein [Streptococcus suis]|uniref:Phage minor tail protein n=4 Tax=Streptococcus suis TaxID=1307 RepID=A0A0Z8V6V2_STRSU|nr:tape measure protein [Streptococcus suis]MBM7286758.1 tape measure protein [Streptococcus suis]MBO4137910.1 tape measure protein [Streptococcus suis]MBO8112167.1 tape measure protein [Streptococcus suis]MBS0719950.1 tape measure protein [Streptococcus suis]MBS0788398.1 tape measure protein [Streptococcus suis]